MYLMIIRLITRDFVKRVEPELKHTSGRRQSKGIN